MQLETCHQAKSCGKFRFLLGGLRLFQQGNDKQSWSNRSQVQGFLWRPHIFQQDREKTADRHIAVTFQAREQGNLADPNSPLRNEECYIPFLEYAIKEGKIDEAYKERYSFQLRNALKNRVGTIANDFKYITREGTTGTLKSIKANYTLIYFNNPDCHDCKRVYNILAGDSPTLAHLVARGELAILALYPDESLTSWNKNKGIYPYNWIVARYARDIDRERYNIPAIPSTYLLDKNKKVIYKDAIIEAVESYLRHKYKL